MQSKLTFRISATGSNLGFGAETTSYENLFTDEELKEIIPFALESGLMACRLELNKALERKLAGRKDAK